MQRQLDSFRRYLMTEEKSSATVSKYVRDVCAFLAFLGERKISRECVIDYKKKLITEGYAVRSINSMLASLNCFLDFTDRSDCKVKSLKLQKEIYRSEEKELTKAEYERLCRTAERKGKGRLCMLLQTVCGTGIRVSELPFITVEAVKSGEARVTCKGKTRTVFLVKALRQKLLRYAASKGIRSGCIFITRTGAPLDRTDIWREMKNLCTEAEVNPKKVFPHNLRHLFARVFYSMEKDIAKLADILGHSSINTTRIYIISTGNEHRQRMENMHLIL